MLTMGHAKISSSEASIRPSNRQLAAGSAQLCSDDNARMLGNDKSSMGVKFKPSKIHDAIMMQVLETMPRLQGTEEGSTVGPPLGNAADSQHNSYLSFIICDHTSKISNRRQILITQLRH